MMCQVQNSSGPEEQLFLLALEEAVQKALEYLDGLMRRAYEALEQCFRLTASECLLGEDAEAAVLCFGRLLARYRAFHIPSMAQTGSQGMPG